MTNSGTEKVRYFTMKRVLGMLLFVLFLGSAGLAAGIYFKVLPPGFVQKVPFTSQYVDTQNSGNDSSNAAQQMPVKDDNNNNVQPVIPQDVTTYPQATPVSVANSNSPNNKINPNIAKVSRIYSGMKPVEAAAILNDLDDKTVLAVLQKMDEDQVAKVLALMDAKRAAVLSKMLLKGQTEANSSGN